MAWVPLHVHSQYSILDSTLSVKVIVKRAKEFQIPSIALTDSGNMFGQVDFFKACKAEGIKPILGCELRMAPTSRLEKKKIGNLPTSFPLVLLVKDKIGYQNLCKLSSLGYIEGFYYHPRIDKDILKEHREGLICLSGSINSPVSYAFLERSEEIAEEEILWYKEVFQDDFYFELQRHPLLEEDLPRLKKEAWVIQKAENFIKKEEINIEKLESFSKKYNIKCVATNDIHYYEKDDYIGHEILLNIQSGEPCEVWERDLQGNPRFRIPNPKRKNYPNSEFYFKSPEQMKALFKDFPVAIENTFEVAAKCNFEFNFKAKHYPIFIPPNLENKEKFSKAEMVQLTNEYLLEVCKKNINKRYSDQTLSEIKNKNPEKDPLELVNERIQNEYDLISSKHLSDYFLIVYDFISWAKSRGIAVGPGRGSAAGSIIAYLLGITDIEPIRFELFFERFINPERISYPDIDVDICMDRRQEVIDYTINKYGKDKVAQIITFGTMKAKMAIKDVGRVFSVPLSKVNEIAKLVPEDPQMTIEKALEIDPELRSMCSEDSEVKMIIEMAKKIEGSIRNTSTHAAGIIISADPLTEHVPICFAKDSTMFVTQFSMKPVEDVGMLKIDFLGLKTLTSIEKAIKLVEKSHGKKIDWSHLPLDDKVTYDLLNNGKTLGVFQFESSGMQELIKKLHIDRFEEIIAVGALYRPGPMDMIPSFINRKHKTEAIEIDHPLMKTILQETYGVMVYQEQVMQIASKLAGYSLGEGDVLRRAMGKKDKKEMERQREKFLVGAKGSAIDEKVAETIFDKIEKFASYGFNKSHAAAYAYLSYVTAYLKANYPKEWMAALMTCDKDDITKVSKFIRECNSMRIPILPPDVNEAGKEFVATKEGIRFAMSGIKGIGEAVVDVIIAEREKKGPFKSLHDFIKRIDKNKIGKKNIELLIAAGAFDFTSWERDAMHESFEMMYEKSAKEQKEEERGILNFFSLLDEENPFEKQPEIKNPSKKLDLLQKEKELLGFYLTSHPMDNFLPILNKLSCVSLEDLQNQNDGSLCRCAFIIDEIKIKIASKTQRKFAILTISDGLDRFELPVWSEQFEKNSQLINENQLIYAILLVENKDNLLRLSCLWMDDLTKINEEMIKSCDETYDRLKEQMRSYLLKKNNEVKVPSKEMEKMININIDANKISLKKILELKNILLGFGGKVPFKLHFFSNEKNLGSVIVDSSLGLNWNEDLKEKVLQVSGVKSVDLI